MTSTHFPGVKIASDGTFKVDCIRQVKGKRYHIYGTGFASEKEAHLAIHPLLKLKLQKAETSAKTPWISLHQFIEKYEQHRLLHVRVSSVHFMRSVSKNALNLFLGLPVCEVFSLAYMDMIYRQILARQCTPEWKNRCFGVLRQMVDMAYRWKYIEGEAHQDCMSVLENIPEQRGKRKEKRIWNKEQRKRFLDAIEDPVDRLMFSLFVTLGARISEFSGLTWDCFDAKKGHIEIKQQLIYADTGKWVLSPLLKTRESYRICKIPSRLVDSLLSYKRQGSGEGFLFRSKIRPEEPLSKGAFRRKMKRYILQAKVPLITPHAIRHERATDLMRVCKTMEEVKASARYLGHSATMMIDTYGHASRNATDAVLRRLEKEENFLD